MEQTLQPVVQPEVTPAPDKRRHFLAVFFLSFMWGVFGADRFYLGKYWTGILKLLTFGGLGLWAIIDLTMVMSGSMRDKQGNEMLEFARYKKFAKMTILIFSLVVIFIIAGVALEVYFVFNQFMQGGGIEKLLLQQTGGNATPTINLNLDQLEGLNLGL